MKICANENPKQGIDHSQACEASMSLVKLAPGTVIGSHYRIVDFIGEGGFAYVYTAVDEKLNRKVAIKLLKLIDISDIDRYKREAQILAQLSHPNIVSIYTMDFFDESTPFLVMEHLEGQALSKLIRQEPLDLELAESILLQSLKALTYLHSCGIIHRDLSPSNIYLQKDADGFRVRLIDFGLAKLLDPEIQKLTRTGALVGNYRYMSPQQILSLPNVDASWDIYAFGYIMMELLSGKSNFESETPLTSFYFHQNLFPSEPEFRLTNHTKDSLFKAIILRCIQKESEDRFSRCDEITEAIKGNLDLHKILPRRCTSWNKKFTTRTNKSIFLQAVPFVFLLAITSMTMLFRFKLMPEKAVHRDSIPQDHGKKIKLSSIEAQKRILAMKEKRYGGNSPYLISPLEDLAQIYDDVQNYKAAVPLRIRALKLRELAHASNDFEKLNLTTDESLLLSLASNYRFQNKLPEAMKVYEKVIALTEKSNGQRRLALLGALESAADTEMLMKHYDEARPFFNRSINILRTDGSNYQGAIQYFGGSMGRSYAEKEARLNLSRALTSNYTNLGFCQMECNDLKGAQDSYKQVLELTEADKEEFISARKAARAQLVAIEKKLTGKSN